MAEERKHILEQNLNTLIDSLDRKYFRKMQIDMHSCAINCCKRADYSLKELHQCVENCSIPLQIAQRFVSSQMENFHSRVERCVVQCRDDVYDKIGPNEGEAEVAKHHRAYDDCAKKCINKMIQAVPNLSEKMHTHLEDTSSRNNYV
ncbi:protein FAM136A-like [Lycorma delicatula]|uniref:protein FAM136A-like n=1 Tax=Lycorma delicatula TaxID=130591 RepID=UPI003F514925